MKRLLIMTGFVLSVSTTGYAVECPSGTELTDAITTAYRKDALASKKIPVMPKQRFTFPALVSQPTIDDPARKYIECNYAGGGMSIKLFLSKPEEAKSKAAE